MKLKHLISILATIAACLLALPILAQDAAATAEANSDPNPLMEMLARIPNTPATQDGIPVVSYIDYRALEAAWPDTPVYESWAEWNAASQTDDLAPRLWMANRTRGVVGPTFWQYFAVSDQTRDLVGFDLLDIDRAATFGTPPVQGMILAGDFDVGQIESAFTARDYTGEEVEGLRILNGGDPTQLDLNGRNTANPFGGELGRRELVATAPGYLLNSPSEAMFQDLVATATGAQSPLSENPFYAAAARAVTQGEGLLVQALFLDPLDVGALPGDPIMAIMRADMDPTQVAEELEKGPVETRAYGFMPVYSLAVMADRQEGEEQVILVALVYNDEGAAEIAAAELTNRLAAFANTRYYKRDTPLIEEHEGASMSEARVYADEATGNYVAIAEARYPLPEPILYNMSGEPAEEGEMGMAHSPGMLFRMWVNAIWQRSFYPLIFIQ